jgi:hypothetical protein
MHLKVFSGKISITATLLQQIIAETPKAGAPLSTPASN